ncbi:site-specific DNA-cytosine methylase [Duganella sp. 1224]|nr:site-specific DNA-cytosine methylase [Duganella sp. 1224]
MLNHGFDGRLGKLSETVIDMLEKDLGYNVKVAIVNCADYGVPQLRERAVFIATSVGTASLPMPTHADPLDVNALGTGRMPWVTVEEAIRDLPTPPLLNDSLGGTDLKNYNEMDQTDFMRVMRTSNTFPYNHITRSYRESVLNIIREMRPGLTWVAESARMREAYATTIELFARELKISGAIAKKRLEQSGAINPVFYKNYYWSAYSRLAWDKPALTITANANFLGSGQFTHPTQDRGITMREAAQLQSFDDDFRFITSDNDKCDTKRIGIGMDMIGEAVPPLLAGALANHLADQLDQRGRPVISKATAQAI